MSSWAGPPCWCQPSSFIWYLAMRFDTLVPAKSLCLAAVVESIFAYCWASSALIVGGKPCPVVPASLPWRPHKVLLRSPPTRGPDL